MFEKLKSKPLYNDIYAIINAYIESPIQITQYPYFYIYMH